METLFVWLARLMFLAIFPISGGMLYRAWRIAYARDFRHVADWRGKRIPNGEAWAGAILAINLLGGGLLLSTGLAILLIGLPFAVWTGAVALILWTYYFSLRIVVYKASGKPDTQQGKR